jgi:uncharacterized membrane protein YfcA
MNAVRRLLHIVTGAVGAALLTYGVIGIAGKWYEVNVAKNDHDLSVAYIVYLATLLVCTALGGWLGNHLHKRKHSRPAG